MLPRCKNGKLTMVKKDQRGSYLCGEREYRKGRRATHQSDQMGVRIGNKDAVQQMEANFFLSSVVRLSALLLYNNSLSVLSICSHFLTQLFLAPYTLFRLLLHPHPTAIMTMRKVVKALSWMPHKCKVNVEHVIKHLKCKADIVQPPTQSKYACQLKRCTQHLHFKKQA